MATSATAEQVQSHVRRALYVAFGALAQYGFTVGEGTKSIILSGVGLLATFAWSMYGERLSSLLAQAEGKTGVEKIDVKVDPNQINPTELNEATPSSVNAKPA